jgi:hypothetical protein
MKEGSIVTAIHAILQKKRYYHSRKAEKELYMTVEAFTINIPQTTFDDLHNRALAHPDSLVGIHFTDIGGYVVSSELSDLSEAEKQYLNAAQQWRMPGGRIYNDARDQTTNTRLWSE